MGSPRSYAARVLASDDTTVRRAPRCSGCVQRVPTGRADDAVMCSRKTRVAAVAHLLVVIVAHVRLWDNRDARPRDDRCTHANTSRSRRRDRGRRLGVRRWAPRRVRRRRVLRGVGDSGAPRDRAPRRAQRRPRRSCPAPCGTARRSTTPPRKSGACSSRRRAASTTMTKRRPKRKRKQSSRRRFRVGFASSNPRTCCGCWAAGAAANGASCGGMVIPLDWDRPWQKWPIPCVAGAVAGFGVGVVAAAACVFFFASSPTPTPARKKTQ